MVLVEYKMIDSDVESELKKFSFDNEGEVVSDKRVLRKILKNEGKKESTLEPLMPQVKRGGEPSRALSILELKKRHHISFATYSYEGEEGLPIEI